MYKTLRLERGKFLRTRRTRGVKHRFPGVTCGRAPTLAALTLALLVLSCTQDVRVEVRPEAGYGQAFVVVRPAEMDRRYWHGAGRRVFPSGSVVNFGKGASPRIAVVDEAGVTTYEEDLISYPMRWYEGLLLPVFGLGYAIWEPYPDPYVVSPALAVDQRLRHAADRLSAEILARVPPGTKSLGLCTFETDVVEKGRSFPYASEGNRRLTEYVYDAIRKEVTASLKVRLFKMGVDWYLKHTFGSLGESVEARHELVGRFARQEGLDLIIYGKNYLYPQAFTPGTTVQRCRFSLDVLEPKATEVVTKDIATFTLAIDPRERELMALFLPKRVGDVVEADTRPPIEVVCERAASQIARDLLEKFKGGVLLASYPKPIHTYVSDFGYVGGTPTDKRVVLPNRYGAYMASKVAQNLMVGSAGTFALVERKAVVDTFDGIPNRGKSIILGERTAWIDPDTWPALGRKVGVKLVFQGRMEPIGADLNVTVWLEDLERGTKLAIVEHKIPVDRFRAREFEMGNMGAQPPPEAPPKSGAVPSPAPPPKEPGSAGGSRELVVPDQYKTIGAAMGAAHAGDTVLLKPGTYRESVMLKDGVRLAGTDRDRCRLGPPEDLDQAIQEFVLMWTEPGTVYADGAEGSVEDLTLDGAALKDEDFPWCGLTIEGKITVRNCVAENHPRGAGIFVTGGYATPTLTGNIARGNQLGIGFGPGAAGVAERNTCERNKLVGIAVMGEGAAPILRGNRCNNNGRFGIGSTTDSKPKIERDNEARGNGEAQIAQVPSVKQAPTAAPADPAKVATGRPQRRASSLLRAFGAARAEESRGPTTP